MQFNDFIELIEYTFDGQINLYRSNDSNIHIIEYFFMSDEIIIRDYNISNKTLKNQCDNLIIKHIERSNNIIDVIVEHILIKINEESYDYDLEF